MRDFGNVLYKDSRNVLPNNFQQCFKGLKILKKDKSAEKSIQGVLN